jgi:hypothetical protein
VAFRLSSAAQRWLSLVTNSSGVAVCVTIGAFGIGSLRVVKRHPESRKSGKMKAAEVAR